MIYIEIKNDLNLRQLYSESVFSLTVNISRFCDEITVEVQNLIFRDKSRLVWTCKEKKAGA